MEDKKTILIVDDALDVRKLLRFHLENKKYNVLEAKDGEEGLALIHQKRPDLIILDINMPKVNGLAVYKELSAVTGRPTFPVLVLTVREELGTMFKDLNVDGFATKPFDIEKVLGEVEAIMAKRYKIIAPEEPKSKEYPKKILIVEDDAVEFNKIVISFINAGFIVSVAKSGLDAIEKIMTNLPEALLVKLGLPDLAGDLLVAKLKQMPRTMELPIVLYTPYRSTLDRLIVDKICEKINIKLVEYKDPGELLDAMNNILQK